MQTSQSSVVKSPEGREYLKTGGGRVSQDWGQDDGCERVKNKSGVEQAVKVERAKNETEGESMYMRNASDGNEKVGGEGERPLPPLPYTLDHTKQTNICNGACSCSCE